MGTSDVPGYHSDMQLRYVALTVFSLALVAVAVAVIYWIAALQTID